MLGLHIADIVVLVTYLVGIIAIGVGAARLVTNIGNYFMPRSFGKGMLIMHAFGTGTHSDQAVGVASKTFTSGLSGIWYQWLWLFCTPFYWLIAPIMRRFRAITVADVFAVRYHRSVGMLFAVVGMFNLMVNIGVMLKGSSAVVASCFGDAVSPNAIIAVMTIMFLIYGLAGGLAAAIITDFVQGIMTIVFSFVLLPFVFSAVGGLEGLRQTINDPQMFSLVAPAEIGMFYIAVIAVNALIGIVTQPHTMGNCASGRTESDGRFGFTVGNFIKRICTMAWSLTGLAAVAYFAGREVDPDQVYGLMAREFLPAILPGLLGVFLAALLASVMSSCDSFMIASSALFTENVYKQLRPNCTAEHYLVVGRLTSLAVVAGGVFFAFWLTGVVEGLEIFWKISPMMGIAFWLGLFWRRATTAGAWASTAAALFAWWLTTTGAFVGWLGALPLNDALRLVVERNGGFEMYLPWQMIFYLVVGTVAGIVVSLLTRPVDEAQLDRYYALVRTPVETGEPAPDEPCTIPAGIEIPPKRTMFSNSSIEVMVPDRSSVYGFVASWALVGAMIYFFFAITR
jgi:Na+/proline symporter